MGRYCSYLLSRQALATHMEKHNKTLRQIGRPIQFHVLIQMDLPVGLHVDAPLVRVESVGRERPLLAEPLEVVDVLVAAVVPLARLPFRVLREGST